MAAGLRLESAVYKPFGEQSEWLSPGQTAPETKGWIGERYDADAGLQYLNARYYDPLLGMFLQPDWFEVMEPGVGTNRYSYSFNDPVNKMDPGGNEATLMDLLWGTEKRNRVHAGASIGHASRSLEALNSALRDQNRSELMAAYLHMERASAELSLVNRGKGSIAIELGIGAVTQVLDGVTLKGALPSKIAGLGAYEVVRGHHAFSKASLSSVAGYDANKALAFGNDMLDAIARSKGLTRREVHDMATAVQRAANSSWKKNGHIPTVSDQAGVAVQALRAMGYSEADSAIVVAIGLEQLAANGITAATKTRIWGR